MAAASKPKPKPEHPTYLAPAPRVPTSAQAAFERAAFKPGKPLPFGQPMEWKQLYHFPIASGVGTVHVEVRKENGYYRSTWHWRALGSRGDCGRGSREQFEDWLTARLWND